MQLRYILFKIWKQLVMLTYLFWHFYTVQRKKPFKSFVFIQLNSKMLKMSLLPSLLYDTEIISQLQAVSTVKDSVSQHFCVIYWQFFFYIYSVLNSFPRNLHKLERFLIFVDFYIVCNINTPRLTCLLPFLEQSEKMLKDK